MFLVYLTVVLLFPFIQNGFTNIDASMYRLVSFWFLSEVAEKVLDKCITYPDDINMKAKDLQLEFDLEFIDDTYTCSHWGQPDIVDSYNTNGNMQYK